MKRLDRSPEVDIQLGKAISVPTVKPCKKPCRYAKGVIRKFWRKIAVTPNVFLCQFLRCPFEDGIDRTKMKRRPTRLREKWDAGPLSRAYSRQSG
jgi:hypothetical protein